MGERAERGVQDQLDTAVQNQVHHVGGVLGHFGHGEHLHAGLAEIGGGTGGGGDLEAHALQIAGDLEGRAFIEVVDAEQHGPGLGQAGAGRRLRLGKGVPKIRGMSHDLAGGVHFRPQD